MGYRVRFGVNITVPMPTLMSIPNANWIFGHEDMTTVKHEMGIAPKDGMIYPSSTWQWEIHFEWEHDLSEETSTFCCHANIDWQSDIYQKHCDV